MRERPQAWLQGRHGGVDVAAKRRLRVDVGVSSVGNARSRSRERPGQPRAGGPDGRDERQRRRKGTGGVAGTLRCGFEPRGQRHASIPWDLVRRSLVARRIVANCSAGRARRLRLEGRSRGILDDRSTRCSRGSALGGETNVSTQHTAKEKETRMVEENVHAQRKARPSQEKGKRQNQAQRMNLVLRRPRTKDGNVERFRMVDVLDGGTHGDLTCVFTVRYSRPRVISIPNESNTPTTATWGLLTRTTTSWTRG